MTPKEKATELFENFENALTIKDCALISVCEIIKLNINDRVFISEDKDNNTIVYSTYNEYWSEVLIEISRL